MTDDIFDFFPTSEQTRIREQYGLYAANRLEPVALPRRSSREPWSWLNDGRDDAYWAELAAEAEREEAERETRIAAERAAHRLLVATAPRVDVFRIEHPESHVGPYNHTWIDWETDKNDLDMGEAHTGNTRTPGPFRTGEFPDYGAGITGEHKFGFESEGHLRRWFQGWRAPLRRCGFVLTVYAVPEPDVLYGAHQLAFLPHAATVARVVRIP